MAMVALNGARDKIVPAGSLEARWLVKEGDVAEFMKRAKKLPKVQAAFRAEEKRRLEADERAQRQETAMAARREMRAATA